MEKEAIFEEIIRLIRQNFTSIETEIGYNTFLSGGGANSDSLDFTSIEIVSLIVKIEDRFNLIIDFDVFYETIGDIVDDLEHRLNSEE